jgi:2-keto-4-pentenoate hydratase/2-oxohepta-3-ene-1,7-dioic acid hydratase in catechol pathway
MTVPYRLATFSNRGYERVGIEIAGVMLDLALAYEALKRESGRRDFFKARHHYTMLDVMEEWELFLDVFDRVAAHYGPRLPAGAGTLPFAYNAGEITFRPPVLYPNKVLNAGSNYYDHALEMGAAAPDHDRHEPYFFYKGSRHTLIGHGDTVILTPRAKYIDWEAELAVVIGREAKNVPVAKALDYVAGYTCYNDISGRDRMRRTGETFDYDWFANKGNDTFGPIGPYIVPRQFVPDPQNLSIKCYVSGELMQDTNTNKMVWNVAELVANCSSITTLSPGDVIATGTGAGVGMGKGIKVNHGEIDRVFVHMYAGKARLLRPGDTVVVDIDQVGRLESKVAAPAA